MRYKYKYADDGNYKITDYGHVMFAEDVRKKLNRLEKLENDLQKNKILKEKVWHICKSANIWNNMDLLGILKM